MTARHILFSVPEWLFRRAAVREARASIGTLGPRGEQALDQARLLLEIARRVQYSAERLPKTARPGVLLGLYREAIYWAMAAARGADAGPPGDLTALWAELPPDELARAVGGTAALEAARRALLETPPAGALDVSREDVAQAGALAKALVGKLDAPRTRVDRLIVQRWLRVLLIVAALVGIAAGLSRLVGGRNLASNATVHPSSSWAGCADDPPCGALLFHTDPEQNPWVELDLGTTKTIHRIDVDNRSDCCSDRAVPLIVEASTDRVSWTQLGRRDTDFSTWTLNFAARPTRYVKLRVPRHTVFHLKDVVIH